ncbi:hypothetical protein R69927_07021 [Paraburkholderia domus]|jgi:Domain of Unknown Function (DUF1521).|uniref:DUF1521 domain-containing protein n=1 Tax=Paraburkholderia domus TaxID=2793075 RepID=A0A9N8N7P7_9BURK|nr:DUF1521 domain-containing protein [Paraburkholderia domus]MBK5054170.1 DUF1521 domain-containing protein [Burkholderia sp. R-70006]MBK5064198.1 DUF1521 domain-containing protein [Burkholderia sp. R-70199]MBK5091196.1 DUF1521 domain-containing protein [Burkholderia sp. R-69927]MBK5125510.1 DUF1521 domain-containing protein [Burkholderia sp. R-69980]MBK5169651.1 DUF1521 domain-containing protein [Burkholderia sp. R-70211]MBK5185312.1 DUF1521 domain-containing protein [Burkholderia sp. R-6974
MQAAMQINNPLLSLQGNINTHLSGGALSQLSNAASFINSGSNSGFNSGRNSSGQLSNMLSGFSKASFSVFSQTTGNGQSSTFIAQGSISNRGQAANQQPASGGRNDNHGAPTSSTGSNRCNDNSRGNSAGGNRCNDNSRGKPTEGDRCNDNRTPSRNDRGCKDSGRNDQTQWSNTAVCDNKASVDLGNYKLDFNKADSSMVMTNTKSGDTTKIWGDPHLTQHANAANSSTAMFNGPMTFMLPDNTKVTVGTQAAANNKNVSFADQVTITHGNQAYQVTGLSEQNKAGLNVQKSSNGRALDAAAPDGYTVQAARDGSGWINPATGKALTADDITKANT